MKIKIKNIFYNKNMQENLQSNNKELKQKTNLETKRRRKGACIKEEKEFKEINIKQYFDNFFKNKNKLSKGYSFSSAPAIN